MSAQPIRGIFTPNLVPLDSRGEIHEGELRRYTDWLIQQGVHGLYPNGSTGEFTRFSPEERRRIMAIIADQTRGRVPILAGAAEANVRETLSACEYYASIGCRAVAIVAPFYYKLSPESVYAYFREIGRNTPIDVTLYNIPLFASPIDIPTIQRLSEECDRIVGIKDSSGDISQMSRMIQTIRPNRPDFFFLTGWDSALLPMLLVGCDGGTHASSNVVPEITRAVYELTTSGRIEEARRVQEDLTRFFDAMIFTAEFPDGFRAGAYLRGFEMGRGRQPLSEKQLVELDALTQSLNRLLKDHGFPTRETGNPTSASSGAGSLVGQVSQDPNGISSIVQGVVSELKKRGMISSAALNN